MNIFDQYLIRIKKILLDLSQKGMIELPNELEGITAEIPPPKFNCDISTNVAMVLSKINKKSPIVLAETFVPLLKKDDDLIKQIDVIKPGFINIKLNVKFWNYFLEKIINEKNYGSQNLSNQKKYLVEFVSANPTGPLHVGHSRGAILGDVISNLLKFNNQKVSKEYYVNDYGNQIIHFTKSVYL